VVPHHDQDVKSHRCGVARLLAPSLQWPLPDDALRIVMRGADNEDRAAT